MREWWNLFFQCESKQWNNETRGTVTFISIVCLILSHFGNPRVSDEEHDRFNLYRQGYDHHQLYDIMIIKKLLQSLEQFFFCVQCDSKLIYESFSSIYIFFQGSYQLSITLQFVFTQSHINNSFKKLILLLVSCSCAYIKASFYAIELFFVHIKQNAPVQVMR